MISRSHIKVFARVITLSSAILIAALLVRVLSGSLLAQGQAVTRVASVSAASYSTIVAPEQIVAAFGVNLAGGISQAVDFDPNTPGIQLPTLLGGVSLEVNGRSAGLFFVSPGQINYQTPPDLEPGTGYVIVRSDKGTIIASGEIEIRPNAPSIFTANASGQGVPAGIIVRVKANGAQSFEPIARLDASTGRQVPLPIDLGPPGERVFLVLFLTGARRVAKASDTRLLIGGAEFIPDFIGAVPELVGLEQLNFELPRSLNGRLAFALAALGYPTSNICEIEVAPPSGTPPRVAGLSVATALAGDRIEISGSGFPSSPTEEGNEVLIADANNKRFNAKIEEAAPTRLRVIVPFGAGSGNLIVRTPRGESTYPFAMRTSVSGIIQAAQLQANGQTTRIGLRNVTVRAFTANGTIERMTNDDGAFLLPDVPPSLRMDLELDGTTTGLPYPKPKSSIRVSAGRDNQFQGYLELKQATGKSVPTTPAGVLPQAAFSTPAAATPEENAFTSQTGQVVFEPNGSTAQFPDGTRVNELKVTALDPGRTPADLPAGQFSTTIAQLTPFGARLTPGGKLTFPNPDGLPAGSTATLYRYDQTPGSATLGQFVAAGSATVSADGQRVETVRDAIKETTYYFVSIPRALTTIYGSVFEEDSTPARGALVQVRGQSIFALTDQNGAFILANVPLIGTQDLTLEVSYLRADGTVDRTERSGVRPTLGALTFVSPPIVLPGQGRTRAPVILAPKTLAVVAGQPSEFPFLAYARVAGQTLRSVTVSGAAFASVIAQGNDRYTLRLTPAASVTGTFTLTLTAIDSQNLRTDEAVAVEVRVPNNPAPSANSQSVSTDEDTPVSLPLSGSNGNVYRIVSPPQHGSLSGTAPNLTYTPARDFNGADSFSFSVSNGTAESSPAVVSIAVRAVNDAPRLDVGAVYTTNIGTLLNVVINGFDVDSGQKLTLTSSGLPTGATITQTTATSWLLCWTPKFDQLGSYTVNLTLRDDGAPVLSDSRTVTIVVDAKWAKVSQMAAGGVTSFASLGNILFAGNSGGGVYRTTDNGVSWAAVSNGLGNPFVLALAVKDNALFAGTDEGGVYRTTDNGVSWIAVINGLGHKFVAALTVKDNALFAGTREGVYRTTDNGANWTAVNNGLGSQDVRALTVKDNALFVGTRGSGVYRTLDNGANWTAVSNGLISQDVRALTVKDNALFAGTHGGVYRTTDNGASWTAVNNGLINQDVLALTVKDSALFAGTREGGSYRTTDNGANWTAVNNGLGNLFVYALTVKDNALFAGSFSGVYLLAESTTTWTESNTGLTNRNVNAATLSGESFLVGTFGGGAFRSTDKGQSWSPANTGLPPAADVRAFTPSGNGVLAGLAGDGVFFSNDQGRNWTARNVGMTNKSVNALAGDGATVYAGTQGGVFRSFDGGAMWAAANTGLTRSQVLSLALSGGAVYAGTDNGLFRSTNQGGAWTPVNTGLSDLYIVALGVAPDGTSLLAGTSSGLFRSSNAGGNQGQSWTPVTQGLPERVVALVFAQQGRRLLAGTVNGFFVSEDNGASWRQINGGLLTLQVGALAVSGNTVLAGTRSGGVFVSQLPQ